MTPPTASAATADSPPAPFAEDPEAVAAAHGADLAAGLSGAEAAADQIGRASCRERV